MEGWLDHGFMDHGCIQWDLSLPRLAPSSPCLPCVPCLPRPNAFAQDQEVPIPLRRSANACSWLTAHVDTYLGQTTALHTAFNRPLLLFRTARLTLSPLQNYALLLLLHSSYHQSPDLLAGYSYLATEHQITRQESVE